MKPLAIDHRQGVLARPTERKQPMTKQQILTKIRSLRFRAHSKADLPLLMLERWLRALPEQHQRRVVDCPPPISGAAKGTWR